MLWSYDLQLDQAMDIQYTWILWQGKNCRRFRFLKLNSFIGQFIDQVGEKVIGGIAILPRYEFDLFREHENLV